MPYYIGDVIKDDKSLIARTPEKFRESGVEVLLESRVEQVDTDNRAVRLSDGTLVPYDTLVFGTGTNAVIPPVPGVDLEGVFVLKTLPDAIRIKRYLTEKQCGKALIIGAGFIGLEMAEAFRTQGIETEMIDLVDRPAIRWDPELSALIFKELDRNDVTFLPDTEMTAIEESGEEAGKGRRLRVKTNSEVKEADIVLVAVGVKPDTQLAAEAGLKLGASKAIKVDFSQRTSIEGIYAVGDCCEVYHRISREWVHMPLGDIANKQGRVAGANIGGGSLLFSGIVGTQSFKLFDLEVAATGIDEDKARQAGFHPVSVTIHGSPIAGSMAGGHRLTLRLVADRGTGILLGAQAIGTKGAVDRINTLSCALTAGMHLDEIAWMDLAYSPPLGSAWDLIHVAAQKLLKQR
jgi:CoA-dependent NAD(P)H sulfur oxidoreductase